MEIGVTKVTEAAFVGFVRSFSIDMLLLSS